MIEPVTVDVLTIANRIEDLRRISAFPVDVGQTFGVKPGVLVKLDTCANEAVFSIMSYANEDDRNLKSVWMLITVNGASLTIRNYSLPPTADQTLTKLCEKHRNFHYMSGATTQQITALSAPATSPAMALSCTRERFSGRSGFPPKRSCQAMVQFFFPAGHDRIR